MRDYEQVIKIPTKVSWETEETNCWKFRRKRSSVKG